MTGIIPSLAGITLTPPEIAAGFTFNPIGSGYALLGLLEESLLDLDSAYVKLAVSIAYMPDGANKTAISAQLAVLVSAAVSDLWDDTLVWDDTQTWAD